MSERTAAIDDAAPGSVLAQRYRVERKLGEGGFATVYLGTHLEVASLEVAIKVLRSAHRERTRIIEGFRREASLLAMLRNRHTVRLIDFGLTEDGRTFIAMEYVRGVPLDRVLMEQGGLTYADTARVAMGVLKSLVEAHDIGVIHQDLKPANIVMVSEPGERYAAPRVLDFGIARVLGERDPAGPDAERQDAVETIFCTPAYAAPELLRGKPDYRTDLYALGLVMTEMIEGVAPYDFEGITASRSPHLTRDPIPFGDRTLQSPLGPIIAKACAKRVKHRFATASEMLEALEAVYDGLDVADTRETRIVVSSDEPIREPVLKAPGATSQFVETQTWFVNQGEDFPDGESGLHEIGRFAATDVVNPLAVQARQSALRRASDSGGLSIESPLPPPRAATGPQLEAVAVRSEGSPPEEVAQATTPAPADGEVLPAVPSRRAIGSGSVPIPDGLTPGFQNAQEVKLFGSTVRSGRVSWVGIVIVIVAIVMPAIITGWSVYRWIQAEEEGAQPMVLPIDE